LTIFLAIEAYVQDLQGYAEPKGPSKSWTLQPLKEAALQFKSDAAEFAKWELEWESVIYSSGGIEGSALENLRMDHNNRMADFETHLLDLETGGGVSPFFP